MFIRKIGSISFLLLFLFSFQNCSTSEQGLTGSNKIYPFSESNLYFKSTQKIVVEVYYEQGAEPFTGLTPRGVPYWQIFEDNINAIFNFRTNKPVVIIPKIISDMTQMPNQNKTDWLGTEILSLNNQFKQSDPTATESRFYIYFLNGYFNSGSGAQTGVIGVSLSGTPVIAIFKDVIRSTGANPNGPVPKYVEQSTLVHELGHALGFVNNGVPLSSNHQDTAHGAHTLNSDCVMYWQNEGISNLSSFVQKFITTGSNIMWGPEVLQDSQSFSQ